MVKRWLVQKGAPGESGSGKMGNTWVPGDSLLLKYRKLEERNPEKNRHSEPTTSVFRQKPKKRSEEKTSREKGSRRALRSLSR